MVQRLKSLYVFPVDLGLIHTTAYMGTQDMALHNHLYFQFQVIPNLLVGFVGTICLKNTHIKINKFKYIPF